MTGRKGRLSSREVRNGSRVAGSRQTNAMFILFSIDSTRNTLAFSALSLLLPVKQLIDGCSYLFWLYGLSPGHFVHECFNGVLLQFGRNDFTPDEKKIFCQVKCCLFALYRM